MVLRDVHGHSMQSNPNLLGAHLLSLKSNRLMVRTLPTNANTTTSVDSRMLHIAFDILAKTLASICKALRDSSIISLVAAINFLSTKKWSF